MVGIVVKRVLMVAYHFPPMNVSSGIQRTLRFAQYLPQFDWEPIVLTAHPRVYSGISPASMADVPARLNVRRAFALDTAKHLSVRGRYPRLLGLPDRWWTWWFGAVPAGLALIRRFKPDVLWSTYPIATAHLIGYTLHRLTGIPWVADFRDPMTERDYPVDRLERATYSLIEHETLKHCERAVFTTAGAMQTCAARHTDIPESRFATIENGYDEEAFTEAEQLQDKARRPAEPLLLVHSGSAYPTERDPRALLAAIAALQKSGDIRAGELGIVLRATGCDDYLSALIREYGVGEIITLAPALPYRAALAEMLAADGLLIMQAASCNHQVPAKLYEYLRARRPVLALTAPDGDTATVLRNAGIDTIAPLDCEDEIVRLFRRFIGLLRHGKAPIAASGAIAPASRRARTIELAQLLDEVIARKAAESGSQVSAGSIGIQR